MFLPLGGQLRCGSPAGFITHLNRCSDECSCIGGLPEALLTSGVELRGNGIAHHLIGILVAGGVVVRQQLNEASNLTILTCKARPATLSAGCRQTQELQDATIH